MELHCDTCARQRIFERPERADRPRATCPDRACTACGAAIVVAPVILLMDRRSRVLVRGRAESLRQPQTLRQTQGPASGRGARRHAA